MQEEIDSMESSNSSLEEAIGYLEELTAASRP
jgi:hypothetical protein